MNLTAGLYAVLVGDATLTGMLASYAGAPAVFTTDPPPADAVLPYIVTAGEVTTTPFDTKTSTGREVRRDIRCYTAATGSAAAVEAIAERVYALLHRRRFPVTGGDMWLAEAEPPFAGQVEDDAYGRIVTARLALDDA